jgi:sugar O-acyltransferase (sialic acid O-acetyltransferase NeuD family)
MIIIGYSGHSFVVHSIFKSMGKEVFAYCDTKEKDYNPYNLKYIGEETSEKALSILSQNNFFISIGDNSIRRNVYEKLALKNLFPSQAIHRSSIVCPSANIEPNAVMISAGAIINPLAKIEKGVICNTGCIIEHECVIAKFAHIGPGAILCGNVSVGENSFIGAGAIIRQGVSIGRNVMVGAGAVVVKNVLDATTVMGCPAK